MIKKKLAVKISKVKVGQLADSTNIRIIGSLFIILMLSISMISCTGEKERQRDTVMVLNNYNRAIEDYQKRAAELWMVFDQSVIVGFGMEQNLWNNVREEHKLDSIEQLFMDKHGEHAFNELQLQISDNFDRKMRR
jgi:hypothetical protein